jgi:hypothetical protein
VKIKETVAVDATTEDEDEKQEEEVEEDENVAKLEIQFNM